MTKCFNQRFLSITVVCFLVGGLITAAVCGTTIEVAKIRAKPFDQLTLVKEWAVKNMDPLGNQLVTSLTANKAGVFVLNKIERGGDLKESYGIQHYTLEGDFVRQWDGEASSEKLRKPSGLASDRSGNIYVADYGVNKIKKFSAQGKFLTTWKIDPEREENAEIDIMAVSGFAVFQDKYVYAVDIDDLGVVKYDTAGKFLGRFELMKEFWIKRGPVEELLLLSDSPFEGGSPELFFISELTVDQNGELFLFDMRLNVVCHLDSKGMLKRWYPVVLNDGFDLDLNPILWKELQEDGMKNFSTAWFDPHIPLYVPAYIACSGKLVFVTLGCIKPFGIVDAVVLNPSDGTLSYFKQKNWSTLKEFQEKTGELPNDLRTPVTFFDRYLFLGRTAAIKQKATDRNYSVVQKFELKGK